MGRFKIEILPRPKQYKESLSISYKFISLHSSLYYTPRQGTHVDEENLFQIYDWMMKNMIVSSFDIINSSEYLFGSFRKVVKYGQKN